MLLWERKPILFLILCTACILVGTAVTMVLPFAWVNTEKDRIAAVKPYSPLQLAGRDIYIREGCNNCHTQTVRPLVAEVLRYGPYSKSGEFAYDRPHLWGSRRTGPDLARVGGKYPDSWQYHHLEDPRAFVPDSNMPSYAFLTTAPIDPDYTARKMRTLGFPYTADEIAALSGKTEADALVAYLQKLGTDIGWRAQAAAAIAGELRNPLSPTPEVLAAGEKLYRENCAQCHGTSLEGGVGPPLTGLETASEAELFQDVYNGMPAGGMPAFSSLGQERVWQVITYLRTRKP